MRVLLTQDAALRGPLYESVSRLRTTAAYELSLIAASAADLPDEVEAILVTGDLQGREPRTAARPTGRLLGEALAERLETLAAEGSVPPLDRTGVILVGDFYTGPAMDRRGTSGDVRSVWRGFADRCRWVTGVAGNHDMFGSDWSDQHVRAFADQPGIHLLDGDCVELDGLRIAGISGIVGNPRRPLRRSEDQFVAEIDRLAALAPDILVMHDGPDIPGMAAKGWPSIRQALERCAPMLVIRGHAYWKEPLATLSNGAQVLNADGRALLLMRER